MIHRVMETNAAITRERTAKGPYRGPTSFRYVWTLSFVFRALTRLWLWIYGAVRTAGTDGNPHEIKASTILYRAKSYLEKSFPPPWFFFVFFLPRFSQEFFSFFFMSRVCPSVSLQLFYWLTSSKIYSSKISGLRFFPVFSIFLSSYQSYSPCFQFCFSLSQ